MGKYADEYLKARKAGKNGSEARQIAYDATHTTGSPMAPKENPYSVVSQGIETGDIVQRDGRYFVNSKGNNPSGVSSALRQSANMAPQSAYERYMSALSEAKRNNAAASAAEIYANAYEKAQEANNSVTDFDKKAYAVGSLIKNRELITRAANNTSQEAKDRLHKKVIELTEQKKSEGKNMLQALKEAIQEAVQTEEREDTPEFRQAVEEMKKELPTGMDWLKENAPSQLAHKTANVASGWWDSFVGRGVTGAGAIGQFATDKLADLFNAPEEVRQDTMDYFEGIKEAGNYGTQTGEAKKNSVTDNLSPIGRFGVNLATGYADILADTVINAATGGAGGLAAMGLRSFGGSVGEMMNEGRDLNQQLIHGLTSAAIEIGTELIGGPFEGAYGKSLLADATTKATAKLASTAFGRKVLNILANAGEEGFEEILSGILNPIADKLTGIRESVDFDLGETLYEGLIGGALGAIGAGGQILTGARGYQGNAQELINFARENGNASIAQEMQKKLDSGRSISMNDAQDLMLSAGDEETYQKKIEAWNEKKQQEFETKVKQLSEAKRSEDRAADARRSFMERNELSEEDMDLAADEKSFRFTENGREGKLTAFSMNEDGTLQAEAEFSDGEKVTVDAADIEDNVSPALRTLISQAEGTFGAQTPMVLNEYEAGQNITDYLIGAERALNILAANGATAETIKKDSVSARFLTEDQIRFFANAGTVLAGEKKQAAKARAAELADIREKADLIEDQSRKASAGIAETAAQYWESIGAMEEYISDMTGQADGLRAVMESAGEGSAEYAKAAQELETIQGYIASARESYREYSEKLAQIENTRFERRKKGSISLKGDESLGLKGADPENLSRKQKQALAMVEAVADAVSVDFVIFDENSRESSNRYAQRGFFLSGGKIYLNINEVMNNGKNFMASTLSHELTHFISEYAPEEYEDLKDFIVEQFYEGNAEYFAAVVTDYMQKNSDSEMTAQQATEEVIAQSCAEMLYNSKAIAELARQHMSLAEKIADHIAEITEKIRAAFEDRFSAKESRLIREANDNIIRNLDRLQELWDKGLTAAERNFEAAELVGRFEAAQAKKSRESGTALATAENKNAAGDGDAKMMAFDNYSRVQIENWKDSKNIIVFSDHKQLEKFISDAKNGKLGSQKIYFGKISSQLAERIKNSTGLNVNGYNCTLAAYEIQKIFKNHGNEKTESPRGQRAITEEDIALIPKIVSKADSIKLSGEWNGKPVIDFKMTDGGTITVSAYVSAKHLDLRVQTMFAGKNKKSLATPIGEQAPINTPEANSGTALEKSITDTARESKSENAEMQPQAKFQMLEDVEETDRLVAVHNKSVSGLKRMLERGGVPFPSIAIKKAGTPHSGFGDVSIVFRRETIDPKADKWNSVYSNDAWTPTEPAVEYDTGDTGSYLKKLKNILGSDIFNALNAGSHIDSQQLSTDLKYAKGDIFEALKTYPEYKYAYLKSIGNEPETKTAEIRLDGFGKYKNEELKEIFSALDENEIESLSYESKESKQKIADILNGMFENEVREKHKGKENVIQAILKIRAYEPDDINVYAIKDAFNKYKRNGYSIPTETDGDELKRVLGRNTALENDPDYKKWVNEFFEGVIKDSGIPNGKDVYTPSGNRRSFKQLHIPATMDNIIDRMRKENEKGVGLFGINLRGAATKKYGSVEDIRADSGKLIGENVTDEVFDSYMDEFIGRLNELSSDAKKVKGTSSGYDYSETEKDIILEAIRDSNSLRSVDNYLKKNEKWIDYSKELAEKVWQLKQDVQNMPAPYFEAKPRRFVSLDEAAAFIVPDNAVDVLNELRERGLRVVEYKNGDETDRLEKLNSIEDARFQKFSENEKENILGFEREAQSFYEQISLFGDEGDFDYDGYANERKISEKLREAYRLGRITEEEYKELKGTAHGMDSDLMERVISGKLFVRKAADEQQRRNLARDLKFFFDDRNVSDADVDDMMGISDWAQEDRYVLLWDILDEVEMFGADRERAFRLMERVILDRETGDGDSRQFINGQRSPEFAAWYADRHPVTKKGSYKTMRGEIRFQNYDDASVKREEQLDRQRALISLRAESKALRDTIDAVNEMISGTAAELRATETPEVRLEDARKLARKITKEFSSAGDLDYITQELKAAGDMAAQGSIDAEGLKQKAREIASYVVGTSEETDESYDATVYNNVRSILRSGISVDEAYAAVREALGNGMEGLLPEDVTQGDMLQTMLDVLDAVGPTKSNRYAGQIGEYAEALANDIVSDVIDRKILRISETLADRFGGKKFERAAAGIAGGLTSAADRLDKAAEEAGETMLTAAEAQAQADRETGRQIREAVAAERARGNERTEQAVAEERRRGEKALSREQEKAKKKLDTARERLDRLRKDKNERISQIKAEAAAARKQAVAEEKSAKWAKVKEVSDMYRERAKEAAQQRQEAAGVHKYRRAVEKRVKKLYDWLEANSQKEHVPERLKKPLAEFLSSISFESLRSLRDGAATQKDERSAGRISKLAQIIRQQQNYQNGAENTLGITERFIDLPEGIAEALDELAEEATAYMESTGANFTINEMSAEELRQLDDVLKAITHAVTTMNHLAYNGRYETVNELARATFDELAGREEISERLVPKGDKKSAAAWANDFLSFDNMVPIYAFEQFGEAPATIFDGIRRGWGRMARNLMVVRNFAEETWTEEQAKKWTKEKHTMELESGEKVTMTADAIMSFYCLAKREQAIGHMTGGGMRTGTGTKHYILSMNDILNICAELTDEQRNVANAIQRFMNGRCSEWGNEVSMARFGIRQFTEDNYFPIETDDTDRNAVDPQQKKNDMFRLLNAGFTKALTKNANNTLVVSGIFDVFANHASDMAKLNGLGLPILDLIKWYNYREKETLPSGQILTMSMQREIERVFGKGGNGYITQFIKDLNGVREGGRGEGLLRALTSNYKVAQIGANLRVVAQQPTSIARAAMEISPKYLAEGIFTRDGYEEMMNNSGLAIWKIGLGFYDVNVNRGIREQLKGGAALTDKIREKSTALAGKADEITWTAMWNACRAEQKAKGLSGQELMSATTERFENLMLKTQVVDSTISRSQIMRSGSMALAEYTGFMSEPTMSYNMLANAWLNFRKTQKNEGTAAAMERKGGKVFRSIAVFAASQMLTSAVAAIADAARDDDDYADWLEKWLDNFRKNFWDNVKPWGLLPIVSDIGELFEYYLFDSGYGSQDNMATAGFVKLLEAIKLLNDQGNYTDWGVAYKTLQAASMIAGLPAAAAAREVTTMLNMAISLYNNLTDSEVPHIHTYVSASDRKYAEKGKDTGLSRKEWDEFKAQTSGMKGIDADGDGKTDSGSKKAQVVELIDAYDLTPEQKDRIYLSQGYAESGLKDTPWH